MQTKLPKESKDFHLLTNKSIAIVASSWHLELLEPTIKRTKEELIKLKVAANDIKTHFVPGSMEIPYAAKLILQNNPEVDAIIAFGIVIKGITDHDEQVMNNVTAGIRKVSLKLQKPIVHEVIGVSSIEDAKQRFGYDKCKPIEAVFATSEILHWQDELLNNK